MILASAKTSSSSYLAFSSLFVSSLCSFPRLHLLPVQINSSSSQALGTYPKATGTERGKEPKEEKENENNFAISCNYLRSAIRREEGEKKKERGEKSKKSAQVQCKGGLLLLNCFCEWALRAGLVFATLLAPLPALVPVTEFRELSPLSFVFYFFFFL